MFSRVTIGDKAEFYENVANLLDGGVSLLDAFRGFHDRTENPKLRQEINNLLFFTEAGDAVSTAMRKLPNFFSEQEVAIVESGEQSGTLQTSFYSLSRELREQEELRSKVVGALVYPFIIFIFLIIAIAIVMIYVIPQLIPIITDTGNVPFLTQALISTSDFLRHNFLSIIIFIIAILLVLRAFMGTKGGRYFFDTLFLKFPLFGRIYRNYLVIRYTSTLALLMNAGITILKVFKLTGLSTGNAYAMSIFEQTAEGIASGRKIAPSMQEADKEKILFTPNILQMIEAGERTSTVDVVARKIAEQYRRQVEIAISMMTKFIEPIAILIAGLFVLWFALAIFSTIMQITAGVNVS